MKKLLIFALSAALFAALSVSCGGGGGSGGNPGGAVDTGTTVTNAYLRIKNESGMALETVRWNDVDFGNIANAASVEKKVSPGNERIFFTIAGKNIEAKTYDFIEVKAGSRVPFAFTVNTLAEEFNDINFTNRAPLPQLKKSAAPEINAVILRDLTGSTAGLSSSVKSAGYPEYAEKGFCHSVNLGEVELSSGCSGVEGDFATTLKNLMPGVKYYVKAYITNGKHPKRYSEAIEFYTKSPDLLLGCWNNSAPGHNNEHTCYKRDGTGYAQWIRNSYYNDLEGYEFKYTATDAKIELTVTKAYWTEMDLRMESADLALFLPTFIVNVPVNQTLTYDISPDGSRLDFREPGTYYVKQ